MPTGPAPRRAYPARRQPRPAARDARPAECEGVSALGRLLDEADNRLGTSVRAQILIVGPAYCNARCRRHLTAAQVSNPELYAELGQPMSTV